MEVIVTEVTRMAQGYICVAGIDKDTGARVRPVLEYGRLHVEWAASHGGKFDYKRVLDIGRGARVGSPPEIEDVLFSYDRMTAVDTLSDEEFLDVLEGAAVPDALAAFGPDLRRHPQGRSYVVPAGKGACSLVIQEVAAGTVSVVVRPSGVRAEWPDGMNLAVTDLRLYQGDWSRMVRRAGELNRLLQRERCFVAFGLTRPFQSGDPPMHHWLQVNAIHIPGALGWTLQDELAGGLQRSPRD